MFLEHIIALHNLEQISIALHKGCVPGTYIIIALHKDYVPGINIIFSLYKLAVFLEHIISLHKRCVSRTN